MSIYLLVAMATNLPFSWSTFPFYPLNVVYCFLLRSEFITDPFPHPPLIKRTTGAFKHEYFFKLPKMTSYFMLDKISNIVKLKILSLLFNFKINDIIELAFHPFHVLRILLFIDL
jgi:hypothetical protein